MTKGAGERGIGSDGLLLTDLKGCYLLLQSFDGEVVHTVSCMETHQGTGNRMIFDKHRMFEVEGHFGPHLSASHS